MRDGHSHHPDDKPTSCSDPGGGATMGRTSSQPPTPPTPPPGFAEITQSLCGDNLPRVVTGIPQELAKDQGPIQMIGSSRISTCLFRD